MKLTEGQLEALECLCAKADVMLAAYPGTTSEFALAWQAFEPNYCWPGTYGFSSQSMQSLVKRGLAGNPEGYRTRFFITEAGRAALAAVERGGG